MIILRWWERYVAYWRTRWAGMSAFTRFGFWLTLITATAGMTLTEVWVHTGYTGPWETYSLAVTEVMLVGMVIQFVGQVFDSHRRRRTKP